MRHRNEFAEHLATTPMFAKCTPKELTRISQLATELDVRSGKELTVEGSDGHEFGVIITGHAAVHHGGKIVSMLGPGDYFGEIALIDGGPRTASITATEPMTIVVVGRPEFSRLLDEVPTIARAILLGLARRLRETESRLVV